MTAVSVSRRRIVRRRVDKPAAFGSEMHPLLARILAARDVCNDEQLSLKLDCLHPPSALKGMSQAVSLLCEQLVSQGRILVVADFDADGATSCAVLLRGLASMGFPFLDFVVPNRFEYGYGLTPEIVALAAQQHPDLIITVDNGISSIEGVDAAQALGIRVLITDHHLPGETLPAADAIINPNQSGCPFPEKSLAGVGVAFYLLLALRARLREQGWFTDSGRAQPNLGDLLDLVALGTVADVVPLERNNRILVNEGLRRIRQGRCCAGIRALIDVAGRDAGALRASDLGFAVAPRLNAAGRLEDMSQGIDCLLTDDPGQAARMAVALDAINRQRRTIEADMREQAERVLMDMQLQDAEGRHRQLPAGLCLYDRSWHQGVVGILASRLKESLHRPVIVFADAGAEEGGEPMLKGSARSVPGLHIRDALERIATLHPGMVSRFGGHAMAAGLSLRSDQLSRFGEAFDKQVAISLGDSVGEGMIVTDGELPAEALVMETASLLNEAGPWGQAFPEPQFDGEFVLHQQRLVGTNHLKLIVSVPGDTRQLDAIAFNVDTAVWPDATVSRARLVYRLDVNRFRGQDTLQLVVEYLEPAE